ncbi:MAG TPA: CPXCG motif-containing cysteine-rich protein [Gammaproteobacteria bacterium]
MQLDEARVDCPYCGEPLELLLDPSVASQQYIEDCAVCCRPLLVTVSYASDGTPAVAVAREDD